MKQTKENKQDLSNMKFKRNFVRVGDFYKEMSHRVTKEETVKGEITGITSGFKSLDELTGGWKNSELVLLAGRPSMGKTSLAITMISNIAVRQGVPAAFFSVESSKDHLLDRLSSVVCDIEIRGIQNRLLIEEEKKKYDNSIFSLLKAPLYIDDTPGLCLSELKRKAHQLVREYGVRIIMIDYIQLMNADGMRFISRQEEVSVITSALKELAMELDISIIATSQLNRGVESRVGLEGKRPQLSDLRESSSLEQDSDMIIFVHRPDYYHIYEDQHGNNLRGLAQIILAKNRNGAIGDTYLKFVDKNMRFEELPTDKLKKLTLGNKAMLVSLPDSEKNDSEE